MRLTGGFLFASVVAVMPDAAESVRFANGGTDFSNSGGIAIGYECGPLSYGIQFDSAVSGFNGGGLTTGNLGSVTFSTGALSSGSLTMGGAFAPGGTFEVDGNGTGGLPNGVLFSGTFSGSVTWTLSTLANGTHNYTLTGVVTGTMSGASVNGVSVQLTINTRKVDSSTAQSATISQAGDTTVASSVPELFP